ncbi:MAG: YceD family protein [Porcipelethomonas sp.]
MVVNLRQVFNITGERRDFEYEIPASELSHAKSYDFAVPVSVKGSFYNRAGIVNMVYSVKFTLNIVCDRCLEELQKDYSFEFEHIVVTSVNKENDDYIIAENDSVDVNEIALSDIILELPTKMLCRDDCKGLCMVCGCNLNKSECNCQNS